MSVKIVQKSLPAGVVPYEEIADPMMKQKVMLLNRNIASLAAQLAEVQRAAIELQQRPMPKQKEIEDIERYVAEAQASATGAASSAESAGQSASDARDSATRAGASATAAGTSERNAADSTNAANAAKVAAEEARNEAVPAAATATQKALEALESAERAEAAARITEWSVTFVLSHSLALNPSHETFPNVVDMSAIVPDISKTYDVTARFFCTYTGTSTSLRYFKVGNGEQTQGFYSKGEVAVATCIAAGTEVIGVINGASSVSGTTGTSQWDVMITIKEHYVI